MADFGKLNFSVAFNPTSAFPLDARSYFESLTEAQAAAASAGEVGSTSTVYHYGQKLLVKEGNAYKWYEIGADKALKETGIYMRSSGGYIQFSTNNTDWSNVIAVSALKGEKGDTGATGETGAAGDAGKDGADGKDGLSAYEIAKNHGFEGSEEEWLESLKGADGAGGSGSADAVTYTAQTLTAEQQAQARANIDAVSGDEAATAVQTLTAQFLPRMLPAVTTDDNEKFLQVVDGKWEAVTIELAEDGGF